MNLKPQKQACLTLLAVAWLVAGCAGQRPTRVGFQHEIDGSVQPWSGEAFDDSPDKFTFAIFSDLNGGERDRIFEVATEQLALLRPEFIVSVGDLIDGASEDVASLITEWDDFDTRAGQAGAPMFRVGGNHDLTGQVLRDVWKERYGPTYYHFVYKSVLFLALDTEDHGPKRMREIKEARDAVFDAEARGVDDVGDMEYFKMPERIVGNVSQEQAAYFVDVIRNHPDVRWTMLLMHKPVWTDGGDEDFVAIESALSGRPYTVFNGHFHRMSYTRRNGRDYIMLATTGGGQSRSNPMSFDHVTLVTVDEGEPSIAHIRLDGILDKTGEIPADGAGLCYQLSECELDDE